MILYKYIVHEVLSGFGLWAPTSKPSRPLLSHTSQQVYVKSRDAARRPRACNTHSECEFELAYDGDTAGGDWSLLHPLSREHILSFGSRREVALWFFPQLSASQSKDEIQGEDVVPLPVFSVWPTIQDKMCKTNRFVILKREQLSVRWAFCREPRM